MSEEELLNYMSFTDDKVIFDKQFYQDIMLPCFNNSINYKRLIKQLFQENKQLEEKIELMRKELEEFLCSGYYCSQGKELYDFCLKINNILDTEGVDK